MPDIVRRSPADRKPPAFYVPMALDPAWIPKPQRQAAAYVLNLIHWKRCCWQTDEQGYVRLKAAYLHRVVPPDVWPPLRDRLEALGVIDVDKRYVQGRRSYGYRLTPEFRRTRRIVCADAGLANRIAAARDPDHVPLLPVHAWLQGKLDSLEFDAARAAAIIADMTPDADSPLTPTEYRELLAEQCHRWATGDRWLVCDKFGRVHTPVTSLPKALRPCLAANGSPLVNLDIANSQPLVAGIVARQFHRDGTTAQRLRDRRFDGGRPYGRLPRCRSSDRADVEDYLAVCESGELYESLMRPGDDRERVKRGYLTAMYGKPHWRGGLADRMAGLYPSVAEMLCRLKRRNFRHAAHVMQNAEATIMVQGVCGWLMEREPDLPVFTIHDSILTTPAGVVPVRRAMLRTFRRLGIYPTIRQETNS